MVNENTIYFYLPDFYNKYELNLKLLNLMKSNRKYFYDNIKIGAIYGAFPGSIWNGGRFMGGFSALDIIEKTISTFNEMNIPIRFTYTNCLLEDSHVYDTYCNLITECANNGKNEILVNSPVLEDYLRNKYPNFKYILSTTKCERDVERINDACKKYYLTVIDYRDNINDEFINALEDKSKIELLINAYCAPNCGTRAQHYESLSRGQLQFSHSSFKCSIGSLKGFLYNLNNYPTVLKVEDIYGKYFDLGFRHFKIEGRTDHMADVIESYVYYLIKPEYKDLVRNELIKHCWKNNCV